MNRNYSDISYAESPFGTLSEFMSKTFGWMFAGLLVTFLVGIGAVMTGLIYPLITSGLFILTSIAELVLVFVLSARVQTLQPSTATGIFFAYAVLNGLNLSSIFLVYDFGSLILAFLVTEKFRQRQNVISTLGQRWHPDFHLCQTVVQVFPESSFLDGPFQIFIRCRHNPHVCHPLPVAADRGIGILLQHSKEHGLYVNRHRADFIQEERTAFCHVEISVLCRIRTGEGAFLVSEQEGCRKFAWQRSAIDRYKLAVTSAVRVNALCHGLLAGTVGTEYQHRHIRRGYYPRVSLHLKYFRAGTSEQVFRFRADSRERTEYLFRQFKQVFPVYRLGQIVFCPQLDGAYRIRYRPVFRCHYEWNVFLLFCEPL